MRVPPCGLAIALFLATACAAGNSALRGADNRPVRVLVTFDPGMETGSDGQGPDERRDLARRLASSVTTELQGSNIDAVVAPADLGSGRKRSTFRLAATLISFASGNDSIGPYGDPAHIAVHFQIGEGIESPFAQDDFVVARCKLASRKEPNGVAGDKDLTCEREIGRALSLLVTDAIRQHLGRPSPSGRPPAAPSGKRSTPPMRF